MRERGNLKREGTHGGNLCVHIFKQNWALKDIQRKKSKQEIYSFFFFLKILLGVQKWFQMPNIDVKWPKMTHKTWNRLAQNRLPEVRKFFLENQDRIWEAHNWLKEAKNRLSVSIINSLGPKSNSSSLNSPHMAKIGSHISRIDSQMPKKLTSRGPKLSPRGSKSNPRDPKLTPQRPKINT